MSEYTPTPTSYISLLLSFAICIPLLLWGIDAGHLGPDGTYTEVARPFYYISIGVTAWIVYRSKVKIDIPAFFLVLCGPFTLLTWGFMYLIPKGIQFIQHKRTSKV